MLDFLTATVLVHGMRLYIFLDYATFLSLYCRLQRLMHAYLPPLLVFRQ
jgi:hypothetical protein